MPSETTEYDTAQRNVDSRSQAVSQTDSQEESQNPLSTRACEECHRKKTKCDMTRPSCRLCHRIGSPCIYPTKRKRPTFVAGRRHKSTRLEGNLTRLLDLLEDPHASGLIRDQDMSLSPPAAPSLGSSAAANAAHTLLESDDPVPNLSDNYVSEQPDDQTVLPQVHTEKESEDGPGHYYDFSANTLTELCDITMPQRQEELTEHQSSIAVSFELAMGLIETFFTHIQPWLPVFHKPRFLIRCRIELNRSSNALINLPDDLRLLLYSLFALAARYSSSPTLSTIPPLERGRTFLLAAKKVYEAIRQTDCASLTYLQGCILLAFNAYTTKLDTRAWILTGVCVRLAYDLGLSEIDDQEPEDMLTEDWVQVEEKRRAWWAIWELDTFGSMVCQRPFAVDRHHFSVKLPVTDDDWFSSRMVKSNYISTSLHQCSMSLRGSENQSPRAWFLAVNHLLSLVGKKIQRKSKASQQCRDDMLVAVNCMKLALPPSFDIFASPPSFDLGTFADCNWIFGTHLLLIAIYAMINGTNSDEGGSPNLYSPGSYRVGPADQIRTSSLAQIIARWPVDYMTAAHPFFMWMMLPTTRASQKGGASDTFSTMAQLILERFAAKWEMAAEALSVVKLIYSPRTETAEQPILMKRFARFFPKRKPANNKARVIDTNLNHDFVGSEQVVFRENDYLLQHIDGGSGVLGYMSLSGSLNAGFSSDIRGCSFDTGQLESMPLLSPSLNNNSYAVPEDAFHEAAGAF